MFISPMAAFTTLLDIDLQDMYTTIMPIDRQCIDHPMGMGYMEDIDRILVMAHREDIALQARVGIDHREEGIQVLAPGILIAKSD